MPTGLPIEDNLDLVIATLDEDPKHKYEETMALPEYALYRTFFQNAKESSSGGKSHRQRVRLRMSNTFQFVRPYQITANNKVNVMETAQAYWRMTEFKRMYDVREDDFNGGPEEIIDHVDVMESAMWEDGIDGLDAALCRCPENSSDDLSFNGLPYCLSAVDSGTEDPDGGFNGQTVVYADGSTGTTIFNIDASLASNSRWRNFCGTYRRMDIGFMRLLRAAITRTNFKMLPQLKGKSFKSDGSWMLMSGQATADSIEELMGANDPSGNDPMKVTTGTGRLRGLQIERVPRFDTEGLEDDVFGVYTKHIFGMQLRKQFLKRSTWKSADNPNIVFDQIDSTLQMFTNNRRHGGFRLTKYEP